MADGETLRERVCGLYVTCLGDERRGKFLETCTFNAITEEAAAACIPKYWSNKPYRRLYTNKVRSLLFNLNNPDTPELKRQLQAANDKEPFRRLVRMSHQEMNPEVWRQVFEDIDRRNRRKDRGELAEDHIGLYSCGRCKSWRTDFTLLQTRSADEPSTAFILCHDCGKRWRMSA